jgi:hypothetical protein
MDGYVERLVVLGVQTDRRVAAAHDVAPQLVRPVKVVLMGKRKSKVCLNAMDKAAYPAPGKQT